jgi:hypothetical protein
VIIEAFLILFGLSYSGRWQERKVEGIIGTAGAKHHQYVYDNGNNVGFFGGPESRSGPSMDGPGGIQPDKIDSRYSTPTKDVAIVGPHSGVLVNLDNGKRDDAAIGKAMDNVNGGFTEKDYHLRDKNCHHYSKEVDKEYVKQGGKIEGDGIVAGTGKMK